MDINKSWLSGIVVTQPVFTKMPNSNTPFTHFILQVNESYKDRSGVWQAKPNLIRVECLGKMADVAIKTVRKGSRYMVDGYIRQDKMDEVEHVRVRSFAIYRDESNESVVHQDSVKQVLEILQGSRDLNAAIEKVKTLIA